MFRRWYEEELRKAKEQGWDAALENVKATYAIGIDPRYYRVWRNKNPYRADRETGEKL